MPRSSSYYKPRSRAMDVDDVLAQRIKHIIEEEPYDGYRMVWATLRSEGVLVNRKAVQRVMQIKRWQCHRRLHKSRYPRVQVSSSIAAHSNLRWATDFTCVWTKFDGLIYVNEIIDCADRSVVGYCISKNCRAQEAVWASRGCMHQTFWCTAARRCRRRRSQRQRVGFRLAALPTHSFIVRPPARVHPPAHAGAERRDRSLSQDIQARMRLAACFATIEEATPVIGRWIDRQQRTSALEPRLPYAGRLAGTRRGTNNHT